MFTSEHKFHFNSKYNCKFHLLLKFIIFVRLDARSFIAFENIFAAVAVAVCWTSTSGLLTKMKQRRVEVVSSLKWSRWITLLNQILTLRTSYKFLIEFTSTTLSQFHDCVDRFATISFSRSSKRRRKWRKIYGKRSSPHRPFQLWFRSISLLISSFFCLLFVRWQSHFEGTSYTPVTFGLDEASCRFVS